MLSSVRAPIIANVAFAALPSFANAIIVGVSAMPIVAMEKSLGCSAFAGRSNPR